MFGGLSRYLSSKEVGHVAELCYLSALRGTDSTGIAIGYRKKKEHSKYGVFSHKMTVPAADFLQDKQTQNTLAATGFFVMGHCRAKTIGDTTVENAHPHECDHIVGTHNGTIGKWGNSDKSDSRELFERIASDGITKAFTEADTGAYACVFADKRARTLNFFRNDRRPLWLMWADNEQTLYWASEKEMLELMAARNDLTRKADEPWLLKEHTLFSVPFGTIDAKVDPIKVTPPPFVSSSNHSVIRPRRGHEWDGVLKEPLMEHTPQTLSDLLNPACSKDDQLDLHDTPLLHTFPKDKHFDDKYYQCVPTKGVISRDEAELCLSIGCSGCGVSPDITDTSIEWRALDAFLCSKCKSDEFANLYAIPSGGVRCG